MNANTVVNTLSNDQGQTTMSTRTLARRLRKRPPPSEGFPSSTSPLCVIFHGHRRRARQANFGVESRCRRLRRPKFPEASSEPGARRGPRPANAGPGKVRRKCACQGAANATWLLMASNVSFASSCVAFTWAYQADPPAFDCRRPKPATATPSRPSHRRRPRRCSRRWNRSRCSCRPW